MATEVSAVNAAPAEKNYSGDKMLYSGMTIRDAKQSPELVKIFDYADYDKDGQLSELEIKRYDGPLVIENYETKAGRVYGNYSGKTGIRSSYGTFNGVVLADNEVDFYPGVKIENVPDKGRVTFAQMDSDKNGELSVQEMQEAAGIRQKINEAKEMLENNNEKYLSGKSFSDQAFGFVMGGSILGLLFVGGLTASTGIGILGGIVVGAVAGILASLKGRSEVNEASDENKKLLAQVQQAINNNLYGQHLYETELAANACVK